MSAWRPLQDGLMLTVTLHLSRLFASSSERAPVGACRRSSVASAPPGRRAGDLTGPPHLATAGVKAASLPPELAGRWSPKSPSPRAGPQFRLVSFPRPRPERHGGRAVCPRRADTSEGHATLRGGASPVDRSAASRLPFAGGRCVRWQRLSEGSIYPYSLVRLLRI